MDDKTEILAAITALGDRVERQIGALDARVRAVETSIAHLEGRVEGRLTEMSARITDIYTRLPVPIAYQPPGKQRA